MFVGSKTQKSNADAITVTVNKNLTSENLKNLSIGKKNFLLWVKNNIKTTPQKHFLPELWPINKLKISKIKRN